MRTCHTDAVLAVGFSPDGRRLAPYSLYPDDVHACGQTAQTRCLTGAGWSLIPESWNAACMRAGHTDVMLAVGFSPNGRWSLIPESWNAACM